MAIRLPKLRPSASSFQKMSVSPYCSVLRQRRREARLMVAPGSLLFASLALVECETRGGRKPAATVAE